MGSRACGTLTPGEGGGVPEELVERSKVRDKILLVVTGEMGMPAAHGEAIADRVMELLPVHEFRTLKVTVTGDREQVRAATEAIEGALTEGSWRV